MKLRDSQVSAARRGLEIGAEDFMLGRDDANPEHEAGRAGYYKPGEQKAFITGYKAAHCPEWQSDYKEGKRDLLGRAIREGVFEYAGYCENNVTLFNTLICDAVCVKQCYIVKCYTVQENKRPGGGVTFY